MRSASMPPIILASASPRRRDLLQQVNIPCSVAPADIDEAILAGETPEEHVLRLATAKALAVAAQNKISGRFILGSDTVVVLDDAILGKPADSGEAGVMLAALSGRSHTVVTGFAVHDRESGHTVSRSVMTRVTFRELTAAEIAGYIASGEPFDKAGAYGIQGLGAFMVRAIDGSYSNVVGLPLCEVVETLAALGAIDLFAGH